MSGTTQGSGAIAKLGEDKKAEGEPPKEQNTQQPALLEEDDEFEDFPVEGMSLVLRLEIYTLLNQDVSQIGPKRKAKYQAEMHICGRRVGTTMIKPKSFQSS